MLIVNKLFLNFLQQTLPEKESKPVSCFIRVVPTHSYAHLMRRGWYSVRDKYWLGISDRLFLFLTAFFCWIYTFEPKVKNQMSREEKGVWEQETNGVYSIPVAPWVLCEGLSPCLPTKWAIYKREGAEESIVRGRMKYAYTRRWWIILFLPIIYSCVYSQIINLLYLSHYLLFSSPLILSNYSQAKCSQLMTNQEQQSTPKTLIQHCTTGVGQYKYISEISKDVEMAVPIKPCVYGLQHTNKTEQAKEHK